MGQVRRASMGPVLPVLLLFWDALAVHPAAAEQPDIQRWLPTAPRYFSALGY